MQISIRENSYGSINDYNYIHQKNDLQYNVVEYVGDRRAGNGTYKAISNKNV